MRLDSRASKTDNRTMASKTLALEKKIQKYPLMAALGTQVFVLLVLRNGLSASGLKISPWLFVLVQSLASALVVKKGFRLPHWLVTISVLLPPLVYLSFSSLSSGTPYGVAFVVLALTFSHTLKERVPLYLTNALTSKALREIAQKTEARTFLDLGSGTGGVVRALSTPTLKSFGVESAPALWVVSSLYSRLSGRGRILRKNIWKTELSDFDMVYAFLSPAVMEELWVKVKKEMRPGSLFISNSFMVPGIGPSEVIELQDARRTKLFLYRL